MQPFGVVAKDNEAYKWIYSLGYNDEEQQRTWVLYNSDDKDYYEPLVPPKEEENLVPQTGSWCLRRSISILGQDAHETARPLWSGILHRPI